jgi:hypothetical protein
MNERRPYPRSGSLARSSEAPVKRWGRKVVAEPEREATSGGSELTNFGEALS